MSGFVILVEFRLKPGTYERFRALIDDNARASVRDEPGCRRFDVLLPAGERDRVVLYEIYGDEAAFAAHLKTPHFAAFDRESAPLVAAKDVQQLNLVCAGSDETIPALS